MSFKSRLDETIEPTDEYRFRHRIRGFVQTFQKSTNLTYEQIEHFCLIYEKLKDCQFGISRTQFIKFLHLQFHMNNNLLLPHVYNSLIGDITKYVNREQFVRIVSLLLCGSLEDKIQFCYKVYSNWESITRKRAGYLMEKSFWHVNEKHELNDVKDLIDLLFRKIDLDRDGVISFDEYKSFVLKNPESIEILGPCLPDRNSVYAFLSTIDPKFIESQN